MFTLFKRHHPAITPETHPFGPSGISPHYWTVQKYSNLGPGPITDHALHAAYVNDMVADNARFIHNLAEFLLGGERRLDLQDLPFVFSGPVSVVQSADFALQAETLVALRGMSTALVPAGVNLAFPEEAPSDGDLLVLGLFEPDSELAKLIEPFDLVLPADTEDGRLEVPGFGSLDPTGIGFVGLGRSDGHTTLILLASDQAGLVSLLETVGQGLLSDCLLSESTGLCQIGEGPGLGASEPLGFDLSFEETFNQ